MDDDIARAARAKKGSPFLSTEQAAFYLGLSARKLQQMRAAATGPSFRTAQPLCPLSYRRSRRLVERGRRPGAATCLTVLAQRSQHCGDRLRRIIAERRRARRRLLVGALVVCSTVPLAASLLLQHAAAPRLERERERPDRPVRDACRPTDPARRHGCGLAARARPIACGEAPVSSRQCAAGEESRRSRRRSRLRCAAQRFDRRQAGRHAPEIGSSPEGRCRAWSGCRLLGGGEYFLLMDDRLSFDGRYFGVTQGKDLLGRAELLWARPANGSSHA